MIAWKLSDVEILETGFPSASEEGLDAGTNGCPNRTIPLEVRFVFLPRERRRRWVFSDRMSGSSRRN